MNKAKWCLLLFLYAVASGFAYELSVGTNSTVILPARNIFASQLPVWTTTNNYANGQYVSISNIAHMCLVSGISGVSTPSAGPTVLSDGTVTWVRVAPGTERRFSIVEKVSGNTAVMLDFGKNATTNSGFVLSYNGAGITLDSADAYHGEISAVSSEGFNTLIVGDN